jgi:tetratricopeptide (TPR) repeat protein
VIVFDAATDYTATMSREKIEARKAKKAKQKQITKEDRIFRPIWLILALVLSLVSYTNIYDNDYLNYDDDIYVTENPPLRNLDFGALYGETYQNQYSPLAMTIVGMEFKANDSLGFIRFMSVLFHLACVAMVFFTFRLLFTDDIQAGLLALLFGVHPLQVESVAWLAASFKIGSFAFFFLLAMWAYLRYKQTNKQSFQVLTFVSFLASCMCKEQAVVFPMVLIALDYFKGENILKLKTWLSKAPYFALSIIFGIITLRSTQGDEVLQKVYEFGIGERFMFACYGVGMYVIKSIVPYSLSMFYTYPVKEHIPGYFYLFPILVLGIVGLAVWAYKRDQRWLFFGIAFFLINVVLAALTAVMSVRDVIMADRYVYLPLLGVFFIVIHLVWKLKERGQSYAPYTLVVLALIYAGMSFSRVDVFQNTITLFSDVIEKESFEDRLNPYLALPFNNRGIVYKRTGQLDLAMADYESAIAADEGYASGYLNRGNVRFDAAMRTQQQEGKAAEAKKLMDLAKADYDKTLTLEKNPRAYSARGAIFASRKQYAEAIADLSSAIEGDKYFVDAYSNRALTYLEMGEFDKAIADCDHIVSVSPNRAPMYELRGHIKNQNKDFAGAVLDFNTAISLDANQAGYYFNRAFAKSRMQDFAGAKIDAQKAKSMGYPVETAFMNSLNR